MTTADTLDTVLSTAGSDITDFIESESFRESLESDIQDWIDLHGLDRVDSTTTILGKQVAFNILLKAALHEQYRNHGYDYPSLDDAPDLRGAFLVAGNATNDPAFDEYVLDLIAFKLPEELYTELYEERHRLRSASDPSETVGALFERLVPQQARQKLGQFRTPTAIAELMSEWLIDEGTERVLDPGMGAGVLTSRTFAEKQSLNSGASVSDMYGVDLNQLAVVMCSTSLQLIEGGEQPNLHAGDIMNANPEGSAQRFATDEIYEFPTVDRVISNPPYSRHQELSEEYKHWVNRVTSTESQQSLSSLSPMYLYFYIHASEFLKPDGKLSFITPSEFLENNYGEALKKFLLDRFSIDALVMHNPNDDSFFEEAMTTSCISFLRKTPAPDDHVTKFINVDKWPGKDVLQEAIEDGIEGETEWGYINPVEQSTLDATQKWTGFADPDSIVEVDALKPLDEFASIKRGIATGDNSYFCLTQNEVDEHGIDEQWLSPIVRKANRVPNYDYTQADWEAQRADGEEVWLLYDVDVPSWELNGTPVKEYIQHGKTVGAHESHLAENREPWYVVDRREPADILYTYMNRNGGRFVSNSVGARNLNNLHGISLDGYTDEESRALLAYLNSPFAEVVVERNGRSLSSGLKKIEPNELKDVPALDPKELEDAEVARLAELFDELCAASRDEEEEQESVKHQINECLEDIFELDL